MFPRSSCLRKHNYEILRVSTLIDSNTKYSFIFNFISFPISYLYLFFVFFYIYTNFYTRVSIFNKRNQKIIFEKEIYFFLRLAMNLRGGVWNFLPLRHLLIYFLYISFLGVFDMVFILVSI